MKIFCAITVTALVFCQATSRADEPAPGTHDTEILARLRPVVSAFPMPATTLRDVAPQYIAEHPADLSWEQAVQVANSLYGQRQPARAAFLRHYLKAGSSEQCLQDLGLLRGGTSIGTGAGSTFGMLFDAAEPGPGETSAAVPVTTARGYLVSGKAGICLSNFHFKGIKYNILVFGPDDRLVHVQRDELPLAQSGYTLDLSEDFDEGSQVTYSANLSGLGGYREYLKFSSDLTLQRREVYHPD